jgi:type II secretory pathway pseudopilin PulG
VAVAGVVVGILSLVVAVVGLSLERRSRRNDLRRLEQQERTRRRAEVTLALRQEYILSHDGLSPGIIAGTEPIPAEWLDARLAQLDRDLGTVRELPAVSGVVVERVIEGDGDRLEVFGMWTAYRASAMAGSQP